jgi:hypothetical protein
MDQENLVDWDNEVVMTVENNQLLLVVVVDLNKYWVHLIDYQA